MSLNGSTVSLLNDTSERIIDYITKRTYVEKLLIEEKEIVPENLKRSLKNIAKEVFKTTIISEDTDTIAMQFNKGASELIRELESISQEYSKGQFPGESSIKEGIKLLQKTTYMDKPMDIFKFVRTNEDGYLDFKEDFLPVKSFFEGEQKTIWEKTLYYIDIFEESRSYVINEEIEEKIHRMKTIAKMSNPYDNIRELPALNDSFLNIYNGILDKELEPVKLEIEEAENRVTEVLEDSGLKDMFAVKFRDAFINLMKKAESCNNVAQVNGFRIEADKLKLRFLNEITETQEKIAKEQEKQREIEGAEPVKINIKRTKKYRNLSIKDINPSNSWQIETKEDLEKYLQNLKIRLEKEIEENTILNIEF